MMVLAQADADMVRSGLRPIADAYGRWLDEQEAMVADLPEHLRHTARDVVARARQVHQQLADGIDFLAGNEEALRCFRFMNRVMANQRVHTQIAAKRAADPNLSLRDAEHQVLQGAYPHHWRVFQIAFILMQIRALTEPATAVRSDENLAAVQLLFFPTGGGKTEAYLGVAAYAFAIRRRQGVIDSPEGKLDGREGVTVIMRYTLRLLTSQQFQRASTLVCAAELERRNDPAIWGNEPFRIGLWVGTNVSPKTVDEADMEIRGARDRGSTNNPNVLQISTCPWCGRRLGANDLSVDKEIGRVFVYCSDDRRECPFADGGPIEEGIPVLTTDEEIYRLVPAFVIATVDKFARLAREGAAASLFGYVGRKCERHGYVPLLDDQGHSDYDKCVLKDGSKHPAKGKHPAAGIHPTSRLRPPDLIIQDELHLITGSLGTTVGLFESAIDVVSTWKDDQGRTVRPLVVASSATVRNAAEQIKNLYARKTTIFPPQVLDAADTFFSKEQPCNRQTPGRRYIGISTTGVRLSNCEIQTAEILLKGSQLLMNREDGGNAADPYMTLVGYFSTTRELAGMARFVQDDISTHVRGGRKGLNLPVRYGTMYGGLNLGELTSRISSMDIVNTLNAMNIEFDERYDSTVGGQIAGGKSNHRRPHGMENHPYDAVLATSMLQVGVDVPRLGLMMVVGQPKNTAEYIQASSRVGRDSKRPGLVVTIGNWSRPRDLAHFEQFKAYHESFYERVEPLSVTPFSVTSLDRGVEGLLVSVARVMQANERGGLTAERNAGLVNNHQDFLMSMTRKLAQRIRYAGGEGSAKYASNRLGNRIDAWQQREKEARRKKQVLVYERMPKNDDNRYLQLMCSAEEQTARSNIVPDDRFVIANSMREVQPEINILVSPDPERLPFYEPEGAPQWEARESESENKGDSHQEGNDV